MGELLNLSDEILVHILAYLCSVDLIQLYKVNKRIWNLSRDKTLSRRLNFRREARFDLKDFKKYLSNPVFENIEALNLNSIYWIPAREFRFLIKCKKLKCLHIADTKLLSQDVLAFLAELPLLENISFSWNLATPIRSSFPGIKTANIHFICTKDTRGSPSLKDWFPALQCARVYVEKITSNSFNLPGFPKLAVCFDSITECIVESNEESVISLPDLINKDKDEINVNSMNPSPSDVSSAKRLNVWPQQEVFNFVLSDLLSQEFTRLTSFRCDVISLTTLDGGIQLFQDFILQVKNTLTEITSATCSSEVLEKSDQILNSLPSLSALTLLYLRNVKIPVGKKLFEKLFTGCQQLENLILEEVPSLTPKYQLLQELSTQLHTSNLRHFWFGMKSWITTDRQLIPALKSCSSLQSCILVDNSRAIPRKLDISRLDNIVTGCKALEFLYLETPAITLADSKLLKSRLNQTRKERPWFVCCVGQDSKIREDPDIPVCFKKLIQHSCSTFI
ncbi:uncharacterized protein LOC111699921 isoform X3 [Eurytemora carolleeae]|uniref:uncharacterized protein LOC111699921 isoform X3 n=1 Tax=Eurytemora carolleeae TaxID=1294199 RepID=UPI000C79309F|nr:uncharacterized protein LOC111699921 isoform X3 [Eurytemora carolleeae]|eukprot:XP_023326468.1 uncharacterized protein LOC111699921 isoform X3 [Eurytemora affinis]